MLRARLRLVPHRPVLPAIPPVPAAEANDEAEGVPSAGGSFLREAASAWARAGDTAVAAKLWRDADIQERRLAPARR